VPHEWDRYRYGGSRGARSDCGRRGKRSPAMAAAAAAAARYCAVQRRRPRTRGVCEAPSARYQRLRCARVRARAAEEHRCAHRAAAMPHCWRHRHLAIDPVDLHAPVGSIGGELVVATLILWASRGPALATRLCRCGAVQCGAVQCGAVLSVDVYRCYEFKAASHTIGCFLLAQSANYN